MLTHKRDYKEWWVQRGGDPVSGEEIANQDAVVVADVYYYGKY